jgi:hypothetical protein
VLEALRLWGKVCWYAEQEYEARDDTEGSLDAKERFLGVLLAMYDIAVTVDAGKCEERLGGVRVLTQPILGSSAPAMTAPSETPTVIAAFDSAMYSPLFWGLVICTAIMSATVRIPAPPAPVITRPTMKVLKLLEREVTMEPMHMITVEKNMQRRGEKT